MPLPDPPDSIERNVDYIIDIDGFQVSKTKYLIKEFGVVNLRTREAHCYHVQLPSTNLTALPYKYRQAVRYATENIHGLEFENYAENCSTEYLESVIEKLVCESNSKVCAIAY